MKEGDVMNNETSLIYQKRLEDYQKTIRCERTDHVIAAPNITYLPMNLYEGCTVQEALEDYEKAVPLFIKYHQEYQPDLAWGQTALLPIKVLEKLDCTFARWPGKHFDDPNKGFQILNHEYMSADEYLEFAEDPSGFMMRKIAPRHFNNLKGLEKLDFSDFQFRGGLYGSIPAALPEVQEAFRAMEDAGTEMLKIVKICNSYTETMKTLGWPMAYDVGVSTPFDAFNDMLRGLINITMDMLECPDELLIALEAKTKLQVRKIKRQLANKTGQTVIFFIHNGMDSFMSLEQFETFYWPGLKACIEAVIESDCIPRVYLEENYEKKLDLFVRDIPAGKCIFSFVDTDMEKVKEKFAGRICIAGGVDGVLLQYGEKEEVIKNVKQMIDICGPGGGYMIDTNVNLDVAKPENLHALFDTARNYLKY